MGRLGVAVVLGWLVFDRVAAAAGSVRGEAGVLVAGVVLATVLLLDRVLLGRGWRASLGSLGLGRPRASGVLVAVAIAAALLAFFPLYARATGARLVVGPGAVVLLPGLFAQGGFAEEVLFRGFLFGRLRDGRTFWWAATLSLVPFVAAHLFLFATLPLAIAAAATLLAAVMSFPLARLYELGGRTIWPPALVHFVAQGAIKLIVAEPPPALPMGLPWMAVCMVVPWLAFAVRPSEPRARPAPGA
jgi:membrane protease YdiL (CAAX protease family)